MGKPSPADGELQKLSPICESLFSPGGTVAMCQGASLALMENAFASMENAHEVRNSGTPCLVAHRRDHGARERL